MKAGAERGAGLGPATLKICYSSGGNLELKVKQLLQSKGQCGENRKRKWIGGNAVNQRHVDPTRDSWRVHDLAAGIQNL